MCIYVQMKSVFQHYMPRRNSIVICEASYHGLDFPVHVIIVRQNMPSVKPLPTPFFKFILHVSMLDAESKVQFVILCSRAQPIEYSIHSIVRG